MRMWDVWSEGYAATGEHAGAMYHGRWPGETFVEAARTWAAQSSSPSCYSERNGVPAYWGCRLFDNEQDARKAFG